MSRGFVKESDQEDLPMIPPRADLPAGTINYVTEVGYGELLAERDEMIAERDNLSISNENEYRISVNFINAKLQLLLARISTAKIVDLSELSQCCALFLFFVTLSLTFHFRPISTIHIS